MSIFTARELWSTRVGQNGEEFDSRCVAVGNADNRKGASHCVVVGSLQGILRIWRPEKRDFSPSDLLLEQDLGAPILQVSLGNFSRQFGPVCIGILHPRAFSVYELSNSLSAQGDNGSGMVQLHLIYTHQLQHVAHMFCSGPFGSRGAQDNHLVCVQSMDGLLSFFDDRAFLFARFLPLFLVPGPLIYVRDTDAFVTVNSSFELMAIKFQAMASGDGQTGSSTASDYAADMSSSASSPGSAIEIGTTKRLQVDWSLQLGEMALDIQCAKQQQLSSSAFDIIVLCEHHIFSITPNGVIRTQKRLGFHPMCIKAYPVADLFTTHPISNLIVASAEGQLRVYSDSNVVWMARLPFVACSVLIAQVQELSGLLVGLSDSGQISVMYLGCEMPVSLLSTEGRDVDYKAIEREQSVVNERIAQASSSSATRDAAAHVLAIDCSAAAVQVRGDGHELDSRSCICTLRISWPGSHPLQTAVLCIGCPSPIYVTPSQFTVENLSRDTVELPFHVFSDGSGLVPHSMTIDIAASYVTSDGSPGCSSHAFPAPLLMFASPCAPAKAGEVSITIGLNKPPPQLPLIFKDICMAQDNATVASSALGLQFPCGDTVSMVTSKDGERIRILAPRFDACMCAVLLLHARLQLTSHVFSFADPLPLPLYFEIIDSHWAARKTLLATSALLAEASAQ